MAFYKYADNPTIYGDNNQAFSSPDQFFAAGGAKNFSNVQTLPNQSTPTMLNSPPNPATPVPSGGLNSNTSFPSTPATSNPTPFVGSLNDSLKYFQDLYTKQQTDLDTAQKERSDLKTLLGEGYDKLNTYSDVYKSTEQELGVPKMYEDLNKLNTQIAEMTASYQQQYQGVETKGLQSGTPYAFIQGEQGAMARDAAVRIGALATRQAAMVGNLELANQRLEKTVELQFKPIENKIKQTLDFLDLNYQDLTDAEKRQADTLKTTLAFQSQQLEQQKEDRSNALMSGVNTKFFKYAGSDLVYDTTTGEGLSYDQYIAKGGKADFSGITEINLAEVSQVQQLMKDFGDAGILPSDSLAVATQKVQTKSKIYADKIRGPVGSGSSATTFKFSTDDRGRLIAVGIPNEDITQIQAFLSQGNSLDDIGGINETQKKVIQSVLSGVTPTQQQAEEKATKQFLSKDYFKNLYTDTQLGDAAYKAGFTAGGFLGKGVGEKGKNDYLDYLEGLVNQYRLAGYTDQEILKMMQ